MGPPRRGRRSRSASPNYAQDSLGDIVFVEAPDDRAARSRPATRSARSRARSRCQRHLRTGVRHRSSAINEALADAPELLNSDPTATGWICTIEMTDPDEFDGLLDADGYRALIEG